MPTPRLLRTLTIAFAVSVTAAAPIRAQLTGGMKGGIGQASFTGAHEFKWETSGPNATGFVNWSGGALLSQQVEVGVSNRRGVSNQGGVLTFSANYLDILLLSKFQFPGLLGLHPFLMVGPKFVYGLACSLEFVSGSFSSNTPCDESTGANRMDYGIALATGLNWNVGKSTFGIEARGSASFRTVIVPLESTASRSLSWTVLAGVAFPINFSRLGRPTGVTSAPGLASALEPIPTGEITGVTPAPAPRLPLTGMSTSTKRITVTAVDADARSLLIAIAREAGINLLVSTDVRRRVSVSFNDASPEEAIRSIIADAGLTVVEAPSARSLPAVVYYQLPVNVNAAPAETIAARFGVSGELAKWTTENRPAVTPPREKQP